MSSTTVQADIEVQVIAPAGAAGHCQILYVTGSGWSAQIDTRASLEEITEIELVMARRGLDYLDYDDEGIPVPEVSAEGPIGFDLYYLRELD